MHIHSVYFWLKPDAAPDRIEAFHQGLASLMDIRTVKAGWYGPPIPSERPIVDDTFSIGLHCLFETTADHDAYQVDPIHDAFVANHKAIWDRVTVYDTEGQGPAQTGAV